MNKLTKLALIGLSFVSMIGLSACAPSEYSPGDFGEVTVTLKDGRSVPCIYRSNWFSCNWDEATVPAPRVPVKSSPTPSR